MLCNFNGGRRSEDWSLTGEFGFEETAEFGGIVKGRYVGWNDLEGLQLCPIDTFEEGM